MSKTEVEKLLEEHGIKVTANRLLVAEALGHENRLRRWALAVKQELFPLRGPLLASVHNTSAK